MEVIERVKERVTHKFDNKKGVYFNLIFKKEQKEDFFNFIFSSLKYLDQDMLFVTGGGSVNYK